MRILQIIDSLATGGAEKLLLDSLPLYRKAGITMDLLVLKDDNYPFMKHLEAQGVCRIYKLGTGSVYNPAHIFKMARIMTTYDLAHVHLFPAQYWAVLAKKWSGVKIKLIYTEHSTSNRRIRSIYSKPIERWFYKNYDRIIVIADEVLKALSEHISLNVKQINLIPNGVDVKTFKNAVKTNREVLSINKVDFLITQVSSFKYPKDQVTLIKSLQFLPSKVKLILVGDGVERKKCEQLVKSLKLEHRVQFLGNRSDVPKLLKTADVVVLSSHYEGMSLSSIEGMASGRPFVASDVPGLTDIVKDAGVLFPQGDAEALAKSIERLMKDQTYNNEIRFKCQERASQYDIRYMVKTYIKLYEQVLA